MPLDPRRPGEFLVGSASAQLLGQAAFAGLDRLWLDAAGQRMRLLERSRIVGDMHDSFGRELSLIANVA